MPVCMVFCGRNGEKSPADLLRLVRLPDDSVPHAAENYRYGIVSEERALKRQKAPLIRNRGGQKDREGLRGA